MEIIIKLIKFLAIINDRGVNMHISKFAVIRCDVGCNFDLRGWKYNFFLGGLHCVLNFNLMRHGVYMMCDLI